MFNQRKCNEIGRKLNVRSSILLFVLSLKKSSWSSAWVNCLLINDKRFLQTEHDTQHVEQECKREYHTWIHIKPNINQIYVQMSQYWVIYLQKNWTWSIDWFKENTRWLIGCYKSYLQLQTSEWLGQSLPLAYMQLPLAAIAKPMDIVLTMQIALESSTHGLR